MNDIPSPRAITEVARDLGLRPDHVIPYGNDKAKVSLAALQEDRPTGRLVLVSAITPTSAGAGKTTTSIALAQGLRHNGESVALALREPSLGPNLGMKGAATGTGRAQLTPAVDINLHFTGDFHAISTAHNLLAAALDNHLHRKNHLGIDSRRVLWPRVLDLNDRSLRRVMVGLGGATEGVPRESSFDITPASEVMASLCLATSAEDLRARLGRLIVALDGDRQPVKASQLGAVGAMMAILRDAMMPNLVQSTEGVPTFVHGGPFANIAHGCNSVLATRMALAHAGLVITEAGFGFDLGGEKFFHIKCASAGLAPAAVVLVAAIRALKRHGGTSNKELLTPDPEAVRRGAPNLARHVESVRAFGHDPIIAINRFPEDSDEELAAVGEVCDELGVSWALSDGVAHGGPGSAELARRVAERAAEKGPQPVAPLYAAGDSPQTKLETVAHRIYGARSVAFAAAARRDLRQLAKLGYGELPLCVAKTPLSLSDDPKKVGRPEDFEITVRRVVLAAGGGFLVPLLGDIMRMPGLPATPQMEKIDLVDGQVVGLR